MRNTDQETCTRSEYQLETNDLILSSLMLKNGHTYFKNRCNHQIFKVCLSIFQHDAWKGEKVMLEF